ncbi:MAG: TIR domain-containing protein [Lachnospiraceae bacterium]|nr:TIR domain-containing protein [Lachnospiraceae bacterium]
MHTERTYLKKGSRMRLEDGTLYEITGEPIGSGGVSVIYPAERLREVNGTILRDGISCALKECFPAGGSFAFRRSETGEVVPEQPSQEACSMLAQARTRLLAEEEVTQQIYKKASRLVPIRAVSGNVTLQLPDQEPVHVPTAVVIMDSLQDKGRTLGALLAEYGSFTAAQTFRMTHQILLALREVHAAGFLHLDIQDGNILIRGALEDESELAELIDFGAARKLTENGRTEPVGDRVLFTTQGFTAPEILRAHNGETGDGELTLGPETDLYSLGCLMLMMLTGKRCDPEVLLRTAERGSSYLPRFQLKKTACPPHLAELLQEVLAKALQPDPAQRYGTADEMLQDVIRFEHAAAPHETGLAEVKYSAFICYRHGEVDSEIAAEVQRELEHFHVSKEISKKKQPFQRVFMDRGEISAGADFGAQIDAALKSAEWLIVICSERTPESVWVRKEIKTFLKYHDRSRILTVLTGGTPETSYPPELLGDRKRFHANAAGEIPAAGVHGEILHADAAGEILAADVRGETKHERKQKLKHYELLRLAAPMLGTTYDALRQRRRSYVLQRAAVVSTVAAGAAILFTAYAFSQNQKLTEAYRRNLQQESERLTEQAKTELEKGNVYGAAELALEALPSKSVDRPVLPAAERVLAQTMNLYVSESAAPLYGVTGVFRHQNPLDGYFVDETHNRLISYDAARIYIWDTENCKLLTNFPYKEYAQTACFDEELLDTENGLLYYAAGVQVSCYDYLSDRKIWDYQLEEYASAAAVYHTDTEIWVLTEKRLLRLNAEDGILLESIAFRGEEEKQKVNIPAASVCDRKSGRLAAVWTDWNSYNVGEDDGENQSMLLYYDEASGKTIWQPWQYSIPDCLLFTDDGDLFVGTAKRLYSAYMRRLMQTDVTRDMNCTGTVSRIDPVTQESRWSQQPVAFAEDENSMMSFLKGEEAVFVLAGDKCVMLSENGEVKDSWEFPSVIVGARMGRDFPIVFTENGSELVLAEGAERLTIRIEADGLAMAKGTTGDLYLGRRESESSGVTAILRYGLVPSDKAAEVFAEAAVTEDTYSEWSSNWVIGEGIMRRGGSAYRNGKQIGVVKYVPAEAEAQVTEVEIPEVQEIYAEVGIHSYKGKRSLLYLATESAGCLYTTLAAVNLEDGSYELQRLPLPERVFTDTAYVLPCETVSEDEWLSVVWREPEASEIKVASVSLQSGETLENGSVDISSAVEQSVSAVALDDQGAGYLLAAVVPDGGNEYYYEAFRFEAGKENSVRKLTDFGLVDSTSANKLCTEEGGNRWAWLAESEIRICDRKGRELLQLPYDAEQHYIKSMCFGPDHQSLFVYYSSRGESDLRMSIYSLTDGALLYETVLPAAEQYAGHWVSTDERTQFLELIGAQKVLEFTKAEGGWELRAIADACGYDEELDSFGQINMDSEETENGIMRTAEFLLCPRRSTEELVQAGREFLGEVPE